MKNIVRRKEEMEQFIVISKGNMGFGPFNWKARKLILKKLLETQKIMGYELITLDELKSN